MKKMAGGRRQEADCPAAVGRADQPPSGLRRSAEALRAKAEALRYDSVLTAVAQTFRSALARALMVMLLCLGAASAAFVPSSHLLIVVGLAGDPEHGELFKKWGTSLAQTATEKLAVPRENVTLLSDAGATRDEITKAFAALASKAGPDDAVFIVLFGHGTFAGNVAKFNLPGPDMTPKDFEPLLDRLKSKRVVFVNTASASGDFVKALSAKGRTIVTATKSAMERNQTEFPSYFVQAFSEEGADADKDQRVSVLEAFTYARREVERFYEKGHLLATEHAVLDDNGDGTGSATPDPATGDGAMARRLFLGGDETAADAASGSSADPRVTELRRQRRAIEEKIGALKARKEAMESAQYEDELEKLLVELARSEAALRQKEPGR
jgi:Peptidase C13 family